METKRLETERLIMRPFKKEDANRYFEITKDEAIQKYVPNACPYSLEEALFDIETYYSKGDWIHDFYIALEDKETHDIVGALIVYEDILKRYDMSIITAKEYRRMGYITEALKAFKKLVKGKTLIFVIEKENLPSIKTVKKLKCKEITKKYGRNCHVRVFIKNA